MTCSLHGDPLARKLRSPIELGVSRSCGEFRKKTEGQGLLHSTEGQSQLLVGSKRLSDSQSGQQKVIGQENEPTRSLRIEVTGGPKLGRINEPGP